jgi:hypothetical protein
MSTGRTTVRLRVGLAALAVALWIPICAGCAGQTRSTKLQDAAYNFNMATRFGRMDVATEMVSSKAVSQFVEHHSAWGSSVRIVDVEFRGLQFTDKDKAVVFVAVGWQRNDEQDLRVTQLAQVWTYEESDWRLTEERRTSGDVGLLGEPTTLLRPESREDAHFPSVTIR